MSGARLDISYDEFIQTSEPRHHAGCQKFIQAVFDAGDIYKGVYQGHYCNGCETFKTEKEVEEGNGRCPNHPNTALVWLEENNYFFRLSAYREKLLAHNAAHPEFIQPESRRNEVINLVETELQGYRHLAQGLLRGASRCPSTPTRRSTSGLTRCSITSPESATAPIRSDVQKLWPRKRPRDRQGHHAVSLRSLAGHADVGRDRSSGASLRPWIRLPQE